VPQLFNEKSGVCMPLFAWKPEYSVKVDDLDSHHQKLFLIINAIYENVMNSKDIGSILPMLDELSAYTQYHFSTEEAYQREIGFPDSEVHQALHEAFTGKVAGIRNSYDNNDLDISGDLIVLLGEWLLQHVLKEDRRYAEWSLATKAGKS